MIYFPVASSKNAKLIQLYPNHSFFQKTTSPTRTTPLPPPRNLFRRRKPINFPQEPETVGRGVTPRGLSRRDEVGRVLAAEFHRIGGRRARWECLGYDQRPGSHRHVRRAGRRLQGGGERAAKGRLFRDRRGGRHLRGTVFTKSRGLPDQPLIGRGVIWWV